MQSCLTTRHDGAWGDKRYSSYSFSTSALDGGQWSGSRPGLALAPRKGPPVPTIQEVGWASPAEAKDFSSILSVQTGSGAHPASWTMGTGGPFPGGKVRVGRDADHSPPSSAEVVNE
jgi:hypothetical protein